MKEEDQSDHEDEEAPVPGWLWGLLKAEEEETDGDKNMGVAPLQMKEEEQDHHEDDLATLVKKQAEVQLQTS